MVVFFGGAPGFRYYNLQFVAAYRRVTLARAAHAIGTLAVAGGSMFNMYLSLAAIMQPSSVSYERIQTGSIVSTWLAWGGLVAKLSLDSECESPFSRATQGRGPHLPKHNIKKSWSVITVPSVYQNACLKPKRHRLHNVRAALMQAYVLAIAGVLLVRYHR